jgi:hypothetical protein
MSGSKTRFGYSGGSDPPDPEETRAARTVFGHDAHLRVPADGDGDVPAPRFPVAPTPVPPVQSPVPPAWTPALPRDIEFADENPRRDRQRQRQGKSRLARFLGRWTKSGRFLSGSRMDADAALDVGIPRDTTGRNVLLVLLVALLTFAVTFAVVKLRQRPAAAPVPTQPAAAAVPLPAPPPAPPAAPAPVLQKAAAPTPPGPTPVPDMPPAAKGLGSPAPAARPQRPARPAGQSARPPEHLKHDLLPLGE